jgi:hypothetical protein
MKLLFILGSARSGSTILANVLERLPGFFSAGELRFLWDRVDQGRRCGCGELVERCPVWSPIVEDERTRHDGVEAATLAAWERRELRLVRTPALLARHEPVRTSSDHPLERLLSTSLRVLEALRETTGATVVIDSSKRPSNGAAMRLLPGVETWYVHLVRDARAVAFSRSQPKRNPDRDGGQMPISSIRSSVAHWSATNVAAEAVRARHGRGGSVLVRYEDFVRAPQATVARIASLVDEPYDPSIFVDERTVELAANHTVSGNPDRFVTGPVTLRPDQRWRTQMDRDARRAVSVLTAPLLLRYGYELAASPRVGAS